MKTRLIAVCVLTVGSTCAAERRMPLVQFEDKVRGGWAGQMVGVAFGAPTEFRSNGRIIEDNLRGFMDWNPKRAANALKQDDVYVDITFAEVIDRLGLDAGTDRFGEALRDSKYSLFHANAAARQLLNRGIKPPMSGHPRYNIHANDIDFQIEADFIGMMAPGLPRSANDYCERVGRVMNYGDGLYGGMFVASMYAAAYFESDPRRVVETAVESIPAGSGYARIIRDVLRWSALYPNDWRRTWSLLEKNWDRDDACPGGGLHEFNIDARLNGAYIVLGLLYGNRDFARTLEIATRSGQDSDCNPSTAGGVLGVMLGYSGIPQTWTAGIPSIAEAKFSNTSYSFNDIVKSTLSRAAALIARAGGRVSAAGIVVPVQKPKAPPLEQWDMGRALRIIEASDPAWTFSPGWKKMNGKVEFRYSYEGRVSEAPGDTAELRFEGTGVVLSGDSSYSGGRADVYLDGRPAGEMDTWIPPHSWNHALWHCYGLGPGSHTLRLVTRSDADSRSTGRSVTIYHATTFHAR